jgi:hypothetical protein
LEILKYEGGDELVDISVSDTSKSPENIIFGDATLSELIEESFGISGDAFASLILSIAESAKSGISNDSASILQKLLDYKCDNKFPFDLRVYALTLRDYHKIGIQEILSILIAPPFSLKGLTAAKLSDFLNKLREKIRKKLS